MANAKKVRKWGRRGRRYAERAEAAAIRAETALHEIKDLTETATPAADRDLSDDRTTGHRRSPAYTTPRDHKRDTTGDEPAAVLSADPAGPATGR